MSAKILTISTTTPFSTTTPSWIKTSAQEVRWRGSQLEQRFVIETNNGFTEEWRVVPNLPLEEPPESAAKPIV